MEEMYIKCLKHSAIQGTAKPYTKSGGTSPLNMTWYVCECGFERDFSGKGSSNQKSIRMLHRLHKKKCEIARMCEWDNTGGHMIAVGSRSNIDLDAEEFLYQGSDPVGYKIFEMRAKANRD